MYTRSIPPRLDELPGPLAFRIGTSTAPLGNTRRGTFWTGGRRVFLDVDDPQRALVLDLEGHRNARVALTVDDPEATAARIRAKLTSRS